MIKILNYYINKSEIRYGNFNIESLRLEIYFIDGSDIFIFFKNKEEMNECHKKIDLTLTFS